VTLRVGNRSRETTTKDGGAPDFIISQSTQVSS